MRLAPGKTPHRRKFGDGRGLYLFVTPGGQKSWRFDYTFAGRRKTMTFGLYPDLSLAKARDRREEARRQIADGLNPAEVKRSVEARKKLQADDSFGAIGREWLTRQARSYAPATLERVTFLLETYAFPELGRQPIATLEPATILTVLRPIERRGRHETAHRVDQLIGQILRYAVATSRATRDVSADLRGALQPVKTTHYAALTDPAAVGALLRAIDDLRPFLATYGVMRIAPHVFVRPGALRRAEWAEFDLDGALWSIPADKMKMGRAHLVPLSTQVIAMLRELKSKAAKGATFVFPSPRTPTQPISDMVINAALRRLGYGPTEMTGHGWRATARTLLDERLRFPPDVIEMQLAHRVRGPLGDTYSRSQWIEQRTAMMAAWSDYLDTLKGGAK